MGRGARDGKLLGTDVHERECTDALLSRFVLLLFRAYCIIRRILFPNQYVHTTVQCTIDSSVTNVS